MEEFLSTVLFQLSPEERKRYLDVSEGKVVTSPEDLAKLNAVELKPIKYLHAKRLLRQVVVETRQTDESPRLNRKNYDALSNYEPPFERLPLNILQKLENKVKLNNDKDRELVKVFCNDMSVICKKSVISRVRRVAKVIIHKYPFHFTDRDGKGISINDGCGSLVEAIYIRFQNEYRKPAMPRKRKLKLDEVQVESFDEKLTRLQIKLKNKHHLFRST